jgi:Tol biopolymer transport system component
MAITSDGLRVAHWWYDAGTLRLTVVDIRTGANVIITQAQRLSSAAAVGFSGNGQVLAYAKLHNGTNQVYVFDFQTGANLLVSARFGTDQPGDGTSDSPTVTPDGRFIAYRSAASDIVPNDQNGQPDIFLFDRQTGANTVLSSIAATGLSADNRSFMPVFSRDGNALFFASQASDIAGNDFNHSSDLFACTFLNAMLLSGNGPGQGPVVSWPWVPGRSYTVEFKDDLHDPAWHELTGSYTNSGVRAFLKDAAPAPVQRIYRIRAF